MSYIIRQKFPSLIKKYGMEGLMAVEIMSPKFFISFFFDTVPFLTNILIFDSFFHSIG